MNWTPVLEPDIGQRAVAAARDVAARLRIQGQAEKAAEIASGQTWFPPSTRWVPWSVSQGNAGLAILWSYMDACFADEDWDLIGRDEIIEAGRSAEISVMHAGLFGGLAGLAFAAFQLSRGGTRYGRLLSTLDSAISAEVLDLTQRMESARDGVRVSEFDAISGLAGVGAYLLLRRGQETADTALVRIAETLAALVVDGGGVPRWHTPVAMLWDDRMKEAYPHGVLNCGLAHGIPGVLAFLALASRQGAGSVPGLREAIAAAGDWLARNRFDDEWGVNWPTAVPLALADSGDGPELTAASATTAPDGPGRCAWCYGSPGIARALWLAGEAIDDAGFRDLAISTIECVYRRPIAARQIDSLTFCHGVAGLLQITLRFAHDTGLPVFTEQARLLTSQILEGYRPETLLGFRDLETAGNEIDQPGLLDGACGIALVLLAAAMPAEPVWDRLFLLS